MDVSKKSSKDVKPDLQEKHGLLDTFEDGFLESISRPVIGMKQIAGKETNKANSLGTTKEAGAEHLVHLAGNTLGSAVLFIGTTALVKRIPLVNGSELASKIAPVITGGVLGFLEPTKSGEGLGMRGANAVIGLGTMSISEFMPQVFGKSTKLSEELWRSGFVNGGAGLFNLQAESLLHQGHVAGLKDSLTGMGTWGLTGSAFHALGTRFPLKIANNISVPVYEPTPLSKLTPGYHTIHLASESAIRRCDVYVPKNYDGTPRPLAVVLHGVTGHIADEGKPSFMTTETGMNQLSEKEGFIVVYPFALKSGKYMTKLPLVGHIGPEVYSWNDKNIGLTSHVSAYSDINFLEDAIADVSKRVSIDSTKRYGFGFSEGGETLHEFQIRTGILDGMVTVHGTIKVSKPIPFAKFDKQANVGIIHGTRDYMLPWDGGRSLMTLHMPRVKDSLPKAQAEFWNTVNDSGPGVVESTPAYDQTNWSSKDGLHKVRQYVLKGGNHAWHGPDHGGWPVVGSPNKDFHASKIGWEFLKNARFRRDFIIADKNNADGSISSEGA